MLLHARNQVDGNVVTGRYSDSIGDSDIRLHRGVILIGDQWRAAIPDHLMQRALARCIRPAALVEGIEFHANDRDLLERALGAWAFVAALPPLGNLSNHYYSVHPRRNDRFVRAKPPLKALFPEVDFATFSFTGHVLSTLAGQCPERFAVVRQELERRWWNHMATFLSFMPTRGVLLQLPQTALLRCPDVSRRDVRTLPCDIDDHAVTAKAICGWLLNDVCL